MPEELQKALSAFMCFTVAYSSMVLSMTAFSLYLVYTNKPTTSGERHLPLTALGLYMFGSIIWVSPRSRVLLCLGSKSAACYSVVHIEPWENLQRIRRGAGFDPLEVSEGVNLDPLV